MRESFLDEHSRDPGGNAELFHGGMPKLPDPLRTARASRDALYKYMQLHGQRAGAIFRVSRGNSPEPCRLAMVSDIRDD